MEETGVVVSASAGLTAPVPASLAVFRLPVTEAGVRASMVWDCASIELLTFSSVPGRELLSASPSSAWLSETASREQGQTALPMLPIRLDS